jgi:hypothetical protein
MGKKINAYTDVWRKPETMRNLKDLVVDGGKIRW